MPYIDKKKKKENARRYYLSHREEIIGKTSLWCRKNRDKRQKIWERFNQKESTKIYKRKWREEKFFSGNATLLTGDNKCYMCGSTKSLVIHHKDGNNGRHGRTINNSSENLVILCRKCHPTVHSHGYCKEVVSNV